MWSRPVALHRSFGCVGFPPLLGNCVPAFLFTLCLFSSLNSASARPSSQTRLNGLTNRVRGPPSRFPQILWPVFLYWTVSGSP